MPLITAWVPTSYLEEQVAEAFTPQSPPEGYSAHFGPEMTLRLDTMRVNAVQRVDLKPQIGAMIASYPELDMPIEMVHGDADTIVPLSIHSQPLMALIPNGALTVLKNAGHMPHHTHPEDVMHMKRTADRLFGKDFRWSVLGAGANQFRIETQAVAMGANIRVGLEDSIWIARGKLAESNAHGGVSTLQRRVANQNQSAINRKLCHLIA